MFFLLKTEGRSGKGTDGAADDDASIVNTATTIYRDAPAQASKLNASTTSKRPKKKG
jgi:hypothetical protein